MNLKSVRRLMEFNSVDPNKTNWDWRETYKNEMARLEKAYQEDLANHEYNVLIIEENRKKRQYYAEVLKDLPKYYATHKYKYMGRMSRGNQQTYIHWFDELMNLEFPIDDLWSSAQAEYERHKNRIEEYRKRNEERERFNKSASEKAEKSKRALMKIGAIAAKYNLTVDSPKEILEEFIKMDKYLNLAHAMRETRMYWGEGCDAVSKALDAIDNESIQQDVRKAIKLFEEDRDGRVFRDIDYNYNRLYQYVPKPIIEDYRELLQSIDDIDD